MPAFSAFKGVAGAGVAAVKSGADWTERSNPKNFRLNAIFHDGTTWTAIGQSDGSDSYLVTSTDAVTWTERSSNGAVFMNGLVFAESLWVAVGNADGGDSHIITASDPTSTWTERTAPEDSRLADITHGNGTFVAVGNAVGGEPYAIWSANGTTSWTRGTVTSIAADLLTDVAYGAGVFCAVGNSLIMSSADDGDNWTDRTSSMPTQSDNCKSIIWDGSQFVVLADFGTVWTSSNGTTSWSELTTTGYTTSSDQGSSIYYDGIGTYVIVGADPTDAQIWYSTDLLAWTVADSGIDADLNNLADVHFADSTWVAVGLEGSDGPDASLVTAP